MKAPQEQRVPKRLPCDLKVGGMRHTGLVLNVSPRGLFVQTSAEARLGTEIAIGLTPPHQQESCEVRAAVVWKRSVPRQMLSAARGGMGLRILEAPENYYAFLSRIISGGQAVAPAPAATKSPTASKQSESTAALPKSGPAAGLPRSREAMAPSVSKDLQFRVRVHQISGPRSRFVNVVARSPKQASRRALAEVGEGWQVLEVRLC